MSAGAVFQEVMCVLNRQQLPEIGQQDILAALQAGRPGPLAFLYTAGVQAELPFDKLLARAAAVYFNFCAGNLADDLMDGECTYLPIPSRTGPAVQYILQTLCFQALAGADVPDSVISSVTHELTAAAGQQLIEVRTEQWRAATFREVAEGIAGRQWSAYLQILWCGTTLSDKAATIGMHAGIAAHVAKDIQSNDPRYVTLPEADRREVVAWASAAAHALHEEDLPCLDALLTIITPILKEVS